MKVLELCKEALRILRRDKGDEYRYNVGILLKKAIEELEELENKSCEGCIHKNENEVMDYDCFECSRYYTDRYKPKDKQ